MWKRAFKECAARVKIENSSKQVIHFLRDGIVMIDEASCGPGRAFRGNNGDLYNGFPISAIGPDFLARVLQKKLSCTFLQAFLCREHLYQGWNRTLELAAFRVYAYDISPVASKIDFNLSRRQFCWKISQHCANTKGKAQFHTKMKNYHNGHIKRKDESRPCCK